MRVATAVVVCGLVATAAGQVLSAAKFGTSGHPTEALVTPDGQYVLVTVSGNGASGIDVFHVEGAKLKRVARQALGGEAAQGISPRSSAKRKPSC